MIFSNDWGSNWISEKKAIILEEQISFDPVISQDGRFLSSMVKNGSSYDLVLRDISNVVLKFENEDDDNTDLDKESLPSIGVIWTLISIIMTLCIVRRRRINKGFLKWR